MSKKTSNLANFSRDLLQRFIGSKNPTGSDPDEEEDDDPELNLGLSLNGRFGIDKSKLIGSSSIPAILPKYVDVLTNNNNNNSKTTSYSGLTRTTSLPVETEEEWRKRKELQSLKRLAAKRRRSEKQKNLTKIEREEYVAAMGRVGSSVGPSLGAGNWDFFATSDGPGSVESQASTLSEFESRQHVQGEIFSALVGCTLWFGGLYLKGHFCHFTSLDVAMILSL